MFLFASTISVSAFLLFLVQPIIAKQILPWFGGSAAVWTTCMVFFQLVLLAGYAYADWLIKHVSGRKQVWVHGGLLVISLVFLPIIPPEFFKPDDASQPVTRILLLLSATIGLPYFLLSTTGPLVQAWFARSYPLGNVYRLYALSNVGSMLALAAYPILLEPNIATRLQSIAWSTLFAAFCVLMIGAGWIASKHATGQTQVAEKPEAMTVPLTWSDQLIWLSLAALASALLLCVTTHITQNVASIPFLWVLPLAIYLVSFILTFDASKWYQRRIFVVLTCIVAPLMLGGLQYNMIGWRSIEPGLLHLSIAMPLYCVGLFIITMFCHGELVRRKPSTHHLTRFYLMISLGGAVGGLLVGVASPLVFSSYLEFPLILCAVLLLGVAVLDATWMRVLAGIACLIGSVLCIQGIDRLGKDSLNMSRNFYGTLRVKSTGPETDKNTTWRLMHGVILHGEQYRSAQFRKLATTYYGESSGVGQAIALMRQPNMKVGLIGMGVGTLAAYGKSGDQYKFYELNPAVPALAETYFSYIKDSAATVKTILGDARLSLEKSTPEGFHVLAVDAFSSDSIPVHLITREAIRVYKRHMAPDGVIAFHISNRYLDLTPIVKQLGDDVAMDVIRVSDNPDKDSYLYRSDWILVTANKALAAALIQSGVGVRVEAKLGLTPWTDDYNNLLQILKP